MSQDLPGAIFSFVLLLPGLAVPSCTRHTIYSTHKNFFGQNFEPKMLDGQSKALKIHIIA